MTTTASSPNETRPQPHEHGDRVELSDAGSATEALAGGAALVLGILGLAGIFRGHMVAIIAIVLGVAFLLEGGAVGTTYYPLVRDVEHRGAERLLAAEIGGGLTADSLAGIAGIALGVMSLLGVGTTVLPAVALLIFGGGLLLGTAASGRLSARQLEVVGPSNMETRLVGARAMSSSRVVLAGGAIVLAILALAGLRPWTLTLVGYLAVAVSLLSSGASGGAALVGNMRHHPAAAP
jgi:hypothetical protein